MNWKRLVSLRKKAVYIIAAMAAALSVTAIDVSYKTYSEDMEKYYMDGAYNAARTVSSLVDSQTSEYVDQIMELYYSNQEMGMTEDYLLKFADVVEQPGYQNIQNILYKYRDSNQLAYLYIFSYDQENHRIVYIFDGEVEEGNGGIAGTWDAYDGGTMAEGSLENGTPAEINYVEPYGWLCTVQSPLYQQKGKYPAFVGVDILVDKMVSEQRAFFAKLTILLLELTVVICVAVFFLMNYGVVVPIKKLTNAVAGYVDEKKGNTDTPGEHALRKLAVKTGDEIEELCSAVQQMEHDLSQYEEELTSVTRERERIGTELSVAAKIQSSMLPCIFPPFPARKEFDLYAIMDPAKEVGGDFYDFFLVDDDHLALVMADVSGKGVGASLFMVIAKILLKNRARLGESPGTILEKVNNQLCENNEAEMFVTVWLGIYEISTGKLTAANAGHEYPVVKHGDGSFELYRDRHGFVLAGMEDVRYTEYELTLGHGDILMVYTDGVPEATSGEEELFGIDRLLDSLNAHRGEEPKDILTAVRADIDRFVGDAPQFDDITMLCMKVR